MRLLFVQLALLTLAQNIASTALTGDVARSLTAEDVAAIEMMVGERPWLIDGWRPLGPATLQTVSAYFSPTMTTSTLRRGAYLRFSRDVSPVPGPWSGMGSALPYVQVAIPGRPFGQIESDADQNLPFTVSGTFQDEELVRLVTYIRSNPSVVPGGRGSGNVGTRPISSIRRQSDGTVLVDWRISTNQTLRATLERRGARWVVTQLVGVAVFY